MPGTRRTVPVAVGPPAPRATHVLYEIVEAAPPPAVDLTKSVKHVLVPARFMPTLTRWQRRYTGWAALVFMFTPFLSSSVLFLPVGAARILSIASFVLQLPLLLLGVPALRADVIRELLTTFDFWFFSFANTATSIVMAKHLGDARSLYLIPVWVGVQYNICVDAAVHDPGLIIASVVVGAAYNIATIVAIGGGLIPDTHSFQVINYGPKALQTEDFLMNTISLIVYVNVRSAYRRLGMLCRQRRARSHHPPKSTPPRRVIRCVTYRCAVKLRPVTAISRSPPSTTAAAATQMRFVRVRRVFDSRNTILPTSVTACRLSTRQRQALHAIGLLGISLTAFVFVALNYVFPYPRWLQVATITGLGCTAIYTSTLVGLYNPQLLLYLCCSFDFVFMAGQFFLAHVFAAYVFYWDLRVYVLAASFLWIMLILTIDALTPVVRQRIGFQLAYIAPVMFCSVVAHLMMCSELAARQSTWRLRTDAVLPFTLLGRTYSLHMLPAFFNRVWMLVMWELRALYRILKATRHDLVMIHGVVDLDMGRREAAAPSAAPTGVVPVAHQ